MSWLAWAVGGPLVALVLGALGMRFYERWRLEGSIDDRATLRSENAQLKKQVHELTAALVEAKRARMSHADVSDRLLKLARSDSAGRV